MGLLPSPRLMPYEGSATPKNAGICDVGEGLSTGALVAVQSAFSPKPQTLVSPYKILVCFTLPPLEPRMSGCERDFVYWPLREYLCL